MVEGFGLFIEEEEVDVVCRMRRKNDSMDGFSYRRLAYR